MKNRKIGLVLAVVFIVPLFLLIFKQGGNKGVSKRSGKIEIVTSCYPVYNLTRHLLSGVNDFNVSNLTSNYLQNHSCLHDYSLTPDNARKLEEASVFIINGAGFESFVADINNKNLNIIDISKKLEIENNNPFVWMSVDNYINQLTFLSGEFCKFFARYKDSISNNFQSYRKELQSLVGDGKDKLGKFEGSKIAVSSNKFDYFLKSFGLIPLKLIDGHSHESSLSSEEVSKAVDEIKNNNVSFFISDKNDPKCKVIEGESGCKAVLLDTLDYDNNRDYVDRVYENLEKICNELNDNG